jgi:hypothetical protein
MMRRLILSALLAAIAQVLPIAARADCTIPAAVEGTIVYNTTHKMMQFCNGADWIAMGGRASVAQTLAALTDTDVTAVADGDCLLYNNGTSKWEPGACGSGGDNLGDHTATQDLDLATNDIINGGAATFAAPLTVGTATGGGQINLGATDATNEGAQIDWAGAGTNAAWHTDVYQDLFRIFNASTSPNRIQIFNFGGGPPADVSIHGNLGVGTTGTPASRLAVYQGDISLKIPSAGTQSILGYEAADANPHMGIDFNYAGTGGANYIQITDRFGGTAIPRVTFSRDGNVGIGTTNPDSKLHMVGEPGALDVHFESPDNLGLTLESTDTNGQKWRINSQADGVLNIDNVQSGGNILMSFLPSGSVGIGDPTADHMLDVEGNIGMVAGSYLNFGDTDGSGGYGIRDSSGTLQYKNSSGSWTDFGGGGATVFNAGSSTTINWANGTTQYTTANCGSFTFSNMADGGMYTLIVQGATSATCSFSHSGLTFKLPPGHGATTASKHTLYSFTRAGSNVYVTWIKGY